jgi:hypothetical protein
MAAAERRLTPKAALAAAADFKKLRRSYEPPIANLHKQDVNTKVAAERQYYPLTGKQQQLVENPK